MKFNMNPGRFHTTLPNGWASFEPKGDTYICGAETNPRDAKVDNDAKKHPLLTARIVVGFGRENGRPWILKAVMRIVRELRDKQVGTPDSTFLIQKGFYKYKESGKVVPEDGTQILLENYSYLGATNDEFTLQVEEIADVLAEKLDQELVLVEFQLNGITQQTSGWRATRYLKKAKASRKK